MLHSTKVEIIWTIVPVVILVVMAIPGRGAHPQDGGHAQLRSVHPRHRLSVEMAVPVHGRRPTGIDFFSTLKQDSNFARELHSGIDPKTVPNYLLDVDHPLVVPSGTKVRRHPHLGRCDSRLVRARFRPRSARRSRASSTSCGSRSIRARKASTAANAPRFAAATMDSCRWSSTSRTPDDFKKWVEEQKAADQAGGRAGGRCAGPLAPLGPSTELKTL